MFKPEYDQPQCATLFVPTDDELRNPVLATRLGVILVELGIPRRQLEGLIFDALFDSRYVFVWRGSRVRYILFEDEISKALGGDASYRWVSDLLLRGFPLPGKKVQKPQWRSVPRLRLLVMTLMVVWPELARQLFL